MHILDRLNHTPAGMEKNALSYVIYFFLKSILSYNHPQLDEYKDEFLSTLLNFSLNNTRAFLD